MVEAGQIVSLLLSLADRLVRVDTCLLELDWPEGEQRQELEARRTLLVSRQLLLALICFMLSSCVDSWGSWRRQVCYRGG